MAILIGALLAIIVLRWLARRAKNRNYDKAFGGLNAHAIADAQARRRSGIL